MLNSAPMAASLHGILHIFHSSVFLRSADDRQRHVHTLVIVLLNEEVMHIRIVLAALDGGNDQVEQQEGATLDALCFVRR
jgi:hypothetical protein